MPIIFSTDEQSPSLGVTFSTVNMDFGNYTYLILNIGTLFFPLILSFDKKVAFYKRWPSIFPAILITASIFIPWDMWKTAVGVWEFNPTYILGIWIGNLPLEEWLFFFTVPYAILFIYECLKQYVADYLYRIGPKLSKFFFVVLLFFTVWYSDRMYPLITFPLTAIFLFVHHYLLKNDFSGRFWAAYFVHLIPFFLVNGVLTSLPVLIYNPSEQIGLRIFTVPIEDSIYSMLLLLMNVTFYEYIEKRRQNRKK